MKDFLKNLYYNTTLGYYIISIHKFFYDFFNSRLISDKADAKRKFKKTFGYKLNLENPQTLNEKIQWLKLNYRTDLHTLCVDKLTARDYIKEKVGEKYLVPLVYFTDKSEELTLDKLPEYPVIMKTNHASSGGIVIVKDKQSIDIKKEQNIFKRRLKQNYYTYSREWQYKNIKPKILIEKLLIDEHGNIPMDYKLHCFHGKVEVIQIDIDRFTDYRRNIYDRQWNLLPFLWGLGGLRLREGKIKPINADRIIPRPETLEEMIILAEKLSSPFYYARIDLYTIGTQVYCGELSFTSENGLGVIYPQEFDKMLGDKLKLPI